MKTIRLSEEAVREITVIREELEEKKILLCDAFAEAAFQLGECGVFDERSAAPLLMLGEYSRLLDALAEEPENNNPKNDRL